MSVRMRHTRGHTGNRRSHHALRLIRVIKDKETGTLRLPHRIDEATGLYRGKQIFTPRAKAPKEKQAKGVKAPSTAPLGEHQHDHAHDHGNAEMKATKGFLGRIAGSRPKARSGMGGQAGS